MSTNTSGMKTLVISICKRDVVLFEDAAQLFLFPETKKKNSLNSTTVHYDSKVQHKLNKYTIGIMKVGGRGF